ncbi:thioesterase II family protein [Pseudonocardia sp. TRM90224]|uniref:thioesterase II family protein n=1 Tax=Pseudonocardia sp. TRM90224 TaxID=2812678 RepID=UPI001E3CB3FB|nr:alpha/beta fold hydrolase [Pseudonocardia sp. TRM90224]
MTATDVAWLREMPGSEGRVQLVCFPHAGAGTSAYEGWAAGLAPHVRVSAVRLPGREEWIREPRYRRIEPLLDALLPALESAVRSPFAFFGHSMGALIAYEAARRLHTGPEHLFVSGLGAPQTPDRRVHIARLPDDDFVAAVRRLNGFPPTVAQDPDLMRLFAPTLRDDIGLCENYVHAPGPPLACPISVFGGTQDDVWQGDLRQWQARTSAGFRMRMLSGDHLFVIAQRERVMQAILEDLG